MSGEQEVKLAEEFAIAASGGDTSEGGKWEETQHMSGQTVCQSATSLHTASDGCDLRQTTSDCHAGKVTTLRSFVSAVHEKYDFGIKEQEGSFVSVPKTGSIKVTVSGTVVLPKLASMSGQEICVAGDPAFIEKMCQKVTELDLMENRLTQWKEVLTILSCSPHLTFLNLAKNRLTPPLSCLRGHNLPGLTHLVLNDTCIAWEDLVTLLDAFPRIEELFLSKNDFATVDLPSPESPPPSSEQNSPSEQSSHQRPRTYPSLQRLYFVGNRVTSFPELCKLGRFFNKLSLLMLSETDDLEGFGDMDVSGIHQSFPCLVTLGLNRSGLKSWEEVEKLRHFPSLTDVRLKAIPFLEPLEEKWRRQHTVALLPNITLLNGSPVYENEREDAERAYIRLYMESEEKPQRYFELEQIHGRLDKLAKVDLAPKKAVRLNVTVEDEDGNQVSSQKLDIDTSQTIRQLIKLLSNVAGRPASKLIVFHVNQYHTGMQHTKLRSSDRRVHSFCMTEGDSIVIQRNG